MLVELKSIKGASVQALDGELGEVDDFYFSDINWIVRYAVVNLGSWFTGKKVLIPAAELGTPDTERKLFPVHITREQVRNSPDIDWKKPVSREMETRIYAHFGWTPYWYPGTFAPAAPAPPPEEERRPIAEPHLHSADAVRGYGIRAQDDEIGHAQEFLAHPGDWIIRYVVVDTSNWPGGKPVLIPTELVGGIHWDLGAIDVRLAKDTIRNSPEYNKNRLNTKFEEEVHSYYSTRSAAGVPR